MPHDRPLIAAVIYNRLRTTCRSGSTPRSATRRARTHSRLRKPLTESDLHLDLSVQHAPPQGPAADPDHEPRHGIDRSRAPIPRTSAYLYYVEAPTAVASCASPHLQPNSSPTLEPTTRPWRRNHGHLPACRRSVSIAVGPAARGAGLACRSQPLAAMHNAALRHLAWMDWRYQRLPVPPELLARDGQCPPRGRLRRGERHDPA